MAKTGSRNFAYLTYKIVIVQFLSLCILGTGVASQLLATNNFKLPTLQSFGNYFLLFVCFSCPWLKSLFRSQQAAPKSAILSCSKKSLLQVLFLSICDVEGNFLLVRAYQYTNLAWIQVLDCFTIPVAAVLTAVIMGRRFCWQQILGVLICIGGVVLLVWHDFDNDNGGGIKGDIFVLCGASLYAVSNVGQEKFVSENSQKEWLALLGIFGTLISMIQSIVLEGSQIKLQNWDFANAAYLALFGACLFAMYISTPKIIVIVGATAMNVGLLTADFYASLASFLFFHISMPPLFWLACILSCIGIAIFSIHDFKENPQGFDSLERDCEGHGDCSTSSSLENVTNKLLQSNDRS